ncbi:MAG: N-acetylglucosamine-6-phosphate deacetylase [Dehalococcoidia bacterium]|nr:MAG: N-acetylglucosamine-6-phosphate deacetylase [Dehalococcoidia bacterium]
MVIALINARVLTPDEEIPRATVILEEGRIAAVGEGLPLPAGAQIMDLDGLTLAPGFIDIHVHGGGGFSLMTEDGDEIRSYARWVVGKGVTAFLPTLAAAGRPQMERWLATAASVDERLSDGASPLGVYLEGPFVNPKRKASFPPEGLRPPDVSELLAHVGAARGRLKLIALAPELAGARKLIAAARDQGLVVSIGHSDATYEEALEGISLGVTHATHCFNAMRPFHHRDPGCLGAILASPQVAAELIADGVHVHPGAMALLLRAKGHQRTILVTDGVAPAGLSPGTYSLAGRQIKVTSGRAILADGTLAGSVSTMDQMVRNLVRLGLATLQQALRMASLNPAAALGLEGGKGRIAPGFDADLVALDDGLEVAMTFVGGELAFCLPKGPAA